MQTVSAGREAQLRRANEITSDPAGVIALGPPNRAELERLLERQIAIPAAVDARYARLGPAVTTTPVFEGHLLDELRIVIVDDGQSHGEALASMRDSLRDLRPAEFLQVTRRIANDTFEQRLLDVSDRGYGLVLSAVQGTFAEDFVGFAFRGFAVSAMQSLDDSNRVLVQQGLLPPFTLF